MLQPTKKTFTPNFCITKVFLIDNCCFNLFQDNLTRLDSGQNNR